MTESVVSFLLGKIGAFLDDERKLLTGVRGEIEFVKDELEHMIAFLRVAEAIEETDPQAVVWVKQVRELAFDIEDVLDEFSLRLARDRAGFLSRFIQCFENVKYRHQIASEIQGIKSRIIHVSEGRLRYKSDVPPLPANTTWHDRRGDALLLKEADLVGIAKPKKQLIDRLTTDDSTFEVISVVGMGGLGKTTLVKKVYDDAGVKKHFKNHAWINVSQSPKIGELLKDMIRQLFDEMKLPTPPRMKTMANHELKETISNFLNESKYLIVLDDVWDTSTWDAFKYAFPHNNCGSRVMITTRIADVVPKSGTKSNGRVFTLKPLSMEDSRTLFSKKTFQGNACPSHLKAPVEYIIKRCEGLPLAIVAIGGLLATKDVSKVDEWEMVKRNLSGEQGNEFQTMRKILLLSYHDLPYYLKACLLYTSAFPEDYEIERMQLIRLWIAEGFVEVREGLTSEEVAKSYLNELFNRSLIQVARIYQDGRIQKCRVHDLLREVILSKSKDHNFVMVLNEQSRGWHDQSPRRLSVIHDASSIMPKNEYTRRLRSLLMFGVGDLPSSTSILGCDLKLLKVLDFRGTNLEIFPEKIVKLYHLTYLSLRNTKVRDVPLSIGKLKNLETLDLKGTHVTKLPSTIVKLQCLRHLLVYHRVRGDDMSLVAYGFQAISGIGCLGSLQQLSMIQIGRENGSSVIQEIGRLNQLRKLRISNSRREDGAALCSSIELLTNLRSLVVQALGDEILDLQQVSSPPPFLQRLKLNGCLEKLPKWITCLENLTKLQLHCSALREDILEAIEALPNLEVFVLEQAFEGERLYFKAEGFVKLKLLVLSDLPGLTRVEVEKGAMPCLKTLVIMGCKLLEKMPLGIEHLVHLKELNFYSVSENLINTVDRSKGGEDYWKVEHIDRVSLLYFQDGKPNVKIF